MKKQFQIFAATFITVALISCSKEKIETLPANQPAEEVTGLNPPGGPIVINPLSVGLIGRFEFNSNLKDTTNQLPNWTSTSNRAIYTTDRKGQKYKAIRFNEAYGLYINSAPVDTSMSVSVWVKNDIFPNIGFIAMVEILQGITLSHYENIYMASSWNGGVSSQYVQAAPMDNKWHHLVATRDKVSLKFYIDGILIGSSPTPAGTGPNVPTQYYGAGFSYNNGYKYWKGSMDDLRIYKRALTAVEVNKLANL